MGFDKTYELMSNFASIIYEALPFIVIGVVIAGLLEEFVPQQAIARIMPRNKFFAIALGAVLGIVFPMCECGIIVVMKRLLRKGLPLSVCVSYMLAGPVINFVVMLSTYAAFDFPDPKAHILGGPQGVVALRVGLSFVVAFITALVVGAIQEARQQTAPSFHSPRAAARGRRHGHHAANRLAAPRAHHGNGPARFCGYHGLFDSGCRLGGRGPGLAR